MSKKRNIAQDRWTTGLVMDGGHPTDPDAQGKNWLGHQGMAAVVDLMLIAGAMREQLEEARNGSYSAHKSHLLSEHGLKVMEGPDGLFRFDWRDVGLAAPPDASVGGQHDLSEGETYMVQATRFERNHEARALCIAHHGAACAVCRLDFGERYGKDFADLIEVHHLRPMATRRERYPIDPVRDLIPVCPNCHAAIHYRGRLRSPEEVRVALRLPAEISPRETP